jgi:hypothetical protein
LDTRQHGFFRLVAIELGLSWKQIRENFRSRTAHDLPAPGWGVELVAFPGAGESANNLSAMSSRIADKKLTKF